MGHKRKSPPFPSTKDDFKTKEKKIILSKTSLALVKSPPLSSSYKKEKETGESKNLPQAFPVPLPKRRSHHPLPSYPWICRKRGQEGVVALKVKINEEGQVTEALLQKSSGHTRLDEVALEALKTWIFVEDSCTKILSIAFRLS
jgi:TonB family protein